MEGRERGAGVSDKTPNAHPRPRSRAPAESARGLSPTMPWGARPRPSSGGGLGVRDGQTSSHRPRLAVSRSTTHSTGYNLSRPSRVPRGRAQAGWRRAGAEEQAALLLAPFLTGTLNVGCVPDGCTWQLSRAALWQPEWVLFWLLVFGSNGNGPTSSSCPTGRARAR